jgi:hypothetical protein
MPAHFPAHFPVILATPKDQIMPPDIIKFVASLGFSAFEVKLPFKGGKILIGICHINQRVGVFLSCLIYARTHGVTP